GVQSADLMEEAMRKAKKTGKLIVAHCEDESLLHGGYIHDGAYAAAHGHKGICSKSEWIQVQRDTELAEKTGAGYHVCHISTKESVSILRMDPGTARYRTGRKNRRRLSRLPYFHQRIRLDSA